jgi:hypothetical protein
MNGVSIPFAVGMALAGHPYREWDSVYKCCG